MQPRTAPAHHARSLGALLTLCMWHRYLGLNVLVFIFKFVLIDRRDENQLVRFILGFKAFQFISGVFPSYHARATPDTTLVSH